MAVKLFFGQDKWLNTPITKTYASLKYVLKLCQVIVGVIKSTNILLPYTNRPDHSISPFSARTETLLKI